jgi:prevent-host-death family protein
VSQRSLSIAEARTKFPSIVHDAERGTPVEITRRGKPVAVLVSAAAYQRLRAARPRFWDAVLSFRQREAVERTGLDAGDLADLRDPSPGRDFSW